MKLLVLVVLEIIILFGCKTKNNLGLQSPMYEMEFDSILTENKELKEDIIIPLKEEYLIKEDENVEIPNEDYFIILGSYKYINNALKFQDQLFTEGFNSQILKSELGFYRVSVFSFNNLDDAKVKVLFIRNNYPQYSDVWLLKKQN